MKRSLLLLSIVSIVLFFSNLNAVENSAATDEQEKVATPNPVKLEPEWLKYFDRKKEDLEQRAQEVKDLLSRLHKQIEGEEEKREAEKKIKELHSHLDSFLLLNQQVVENPNLEWLPKESYTLDDYIKISDRTRDLKLDINYKNTDLKRFTYSANDSRQTLNNAYAKYLTLPKNSKERFLQGLKVMTIGVRLLYLEAEAQLIERLIEIDEQMLVRYREEKDQIDNKLHVEINLEKVNEETEKLRSDLANVHQELLELEFQSIKKYTQQNGEETSRLINQKLTNILLKEAFFRAKLFLSEAKSTLYAAITSPGQINYSQNVEPIKAFTNETYNQLKSWEEIVSSEIDLLSQVLVKIDGKTEEAVPSQTYEESLKIALSNRVFLDSLTNKLFHIELVLELIGEHVLEKQAVMDQISYHSQSFWQSLNESFGAWLHYSLFDLGGVPITLMGILKAVLIILVAIWISNIIGKTLKRLGKGKGKVAESTFYTFRRVIHYIILLVGILFALASLGLTMRNMAIVLGAVGIGIGLGLQNIVNNFLCGLAILLERNVKVGDYVELESGLMGKIIEVNIQNTTLHTFDGVDVLVPNSSFIAHNVVNWTKKDPYQRLHIPFGVAYGTDQAKVSEVVREASLTVPYTLGVKEGVGDPEVWLVEFGDSSLNFELVVWVNIFKSRGRRAMKAKYLSAIELALKEHDIHIPFPQRDLHLKTLTEH